MGVASSLSFRAIRIAHKIPLTIASVAVACTAMAGSVSYWKSKTQLEDQVEAELSTLLVVRTAHFSEYLHGIEQDLRFQAANPLVTALKDLRQLGARSTAVAYPVVPGSSISSVCAVSKA